MRIADLPDVIVVIVDALIHRGSRRRETTSIDAGEPLWGSWAPSADACKNADKSVVV